MGPVLTIMVWQVRRGRRSLVVLALAVALTTAFVMTAATGARRTASAWTRMREHTSAPDVESWVYADADELEAALRARPDVVATGQYAWMFVYALLDGGDPDGMYVALSDSYGRDIAVPVIVAGRAADPARADELTINEAMAELTGLRPGDRIELRSGPEVVEQPATVVGVHRGTRDLNEDAGLVSAILTPAFGRRWFAPYRDTRSATSPEGYPTAVSARFAPGTDLDRVVADLRQQFPDQAPGRVDATIALGDALDAQRTAYTLLAAIGALGALAALGQAITRRIRRSTDELAVLSVLGLSRPQRLAAVVGAPLAAGALGAALALVGAYAASSTIPRGLAGRVDPATGRQVDWLVGAAGAGTVVVLLGLLGVAAASRAGAGRQAQVIPSRRSTRVTDPARLFGLRVAGGWGTRASRTSARAQVVGVAGAIALVVAVATWSAAAHHVSAHQRLWGTTWDVTVGINEEAFAFAEVMLPIVSDLSDRMTRDGSLVTGLAAVQVGTVTIDGHQLEATVIDTRRGSIWPPVVHGREARAPDEIDAGRGIVSRAGWKLGASLPVGATSVRLVGEVVVQELGNGLFGETVVMSPAALERIGGFDNTNSSYLFVDLARGVSTDALATELGDQFEIVDPGPPSPVLGIGAIGSVDELLLAFIAALGLAALVHGVQTAARQRRRDHAVLRAIGARSHFIASATAWQTAFTVGSGALVGIPVGWVLGRLVWSRTASGMGVVVAYPSPVQVLAAIAAATLAVAAIVAIALGTMAARWSSTRALRQE